MLTNAHVVELLRTEPNLSLGVIPSEGKKSYGGRVIAFSPGNDLALIQLTSGQLPVSTFFAGAVTDGQHVTAIGYPGVVDRAQGLSLSEMIAPVSPVKTSGNVSTGRSSHSFDTLLHTAPMAQGNSGGPLVDDCGRVLGVNSFGSQGESDADAEFGFAVSNREIASFLRQAGVQFQRTTIPCRSIAELDALEAQRAQDELEKQDALDAAQRAQRDQALQNARQEAQQDVISGRENAIAVAAVLLAFGVLAVGAAGLFHTQGKTRTRNQAGAVGAVLLLGAGAAFFLRPSFSSIDDRITLPANMTDAALEDGASFDAVGDNICRIDESRSRITVSETTDVPIRWADRGCVNGSAQYIEDNEGWSRVLVPASDATISINRFNPKTGDFRTDRYLADASTMDKARALRARFGAGQCTQDHEQLTKQAQAQAEIRAVLPPQPNERLVYRCTKGTPAPAP